MSGLLTCAQAGLQVLSTPEDLDLSDVIQKIVFVAMSVGNTLTPRYLSLESFNPDTYTGDGPLTVENGKLMYIDGRMVESKEQEPSIKFEVQTLNPSG